MMGIRDSGFRIQGGGDARQMAGLADSCIQSPASSKGFTLVEMIMVIVITGIIGGIVAVFLKAPVQQYMDVARRADMTDIADTALRRVGRDLRAALPNSVRVTGPCGGADSCVIEFLPVKGGGRYRIGAGGTNEELDFTGPANAFEVLGPMPSLVVGDQIVVYNLGISGADAYAGDNRATVSDPPAGAVAKITSKLFPFDSPGHRFHVVTSPVRYVCAPDAVNPTLGTLTRYSGYGWAVPSGTGNLLAKNVSSCKFSYDALVVAQRSGLMTMTLGISEEGETVTLYSAAHVSNQP